MMTEQTKKLIDQFRLRRDLTGVAYIILSMQEEDNVSEVLRYKNCFRLLRNMAAHEPETIAQQLMDETNLGARKIVFTRVSGEVVVLDMLQFAVWMMDMYLQTSTAEYLIFLKVLYSILYKQAIASFEKTELFQFRIRGEAGLLHAYADWMTYMHKYYGCIKPIAVTDPYVTSLYKENRKVFWKVALPDMMMLACFYMTPNVVLSSKENLEYFTMLCSQREV